MHHIFNAAIQYIFKGNQSNQSRVTGVNLCGIKQVLVFSQVYAWSGPHLWRSVNEGTTWSVDPANTPVNLYRTGAVASQQETNLTKPKKHKDEKEPPKHFNSTDAERSKTNFQRQRERKCSGREQTRSITNRAAADQTTTGKDFTQGGEAVSPRQDTCATQTHSHACSHAHKAFGFLPPAFVSSQGLQLKGGGGLGTSPPLPLVHEFTSTGALLRTRYEWCFDFNSSHQSYYHVIFIVRWGASQKEK